MIRRLIVIVAAAVILAAAAVASEVRIFRLQSQEAFLEGTFDGVSVDSLGTLRLTAAATRLTALEEPFVLAAATHPDGWVLGTGNAGRVLLVRKDGSVEELMDAAEPEVFAVWVDDDGVVYAGTSPAGKVYRIVDGEAEVFFDPGQTYIWQIVGRDGSLVVATGTEGRLYAVDRDGDGELLWDSDDTHIRAVTVLEDGDLLVGTAGEGLIVRIEADGRIRTLYDADQPEVVAFAEGSDGTAYAAVVASEASQLPAPRAREGEESEGEGSVVVVVEETQGEMVGSRPRGYQGPRSEILRIAPSGTVEGVARLEDDTVYSLAFLGGHLWIGTGLEGKLFRLSGDELVLENDVEERQIMSLLADDGHPAFATTNAAAFYRLGVDRARKGTYTSPVLDAGQIARFGTFRWMGQTGRKGRVGFSFRSGISTEPDQTWSEWSELASGDELGLLAVPAARFIQWRLEMSGSEIAGPSLVGVELSYRQDNLAPRISSLEVLDPGKVIVSINFNPSKQVFEPAHPTRDGMFTTLKAATTKDDARTKELWKHGFRTLRWKAEDPNEDELTYRLEFRLVEREAWLSVVADRKEAYYSFDATALPDGIYRFRLVASDRANGEGLEAERVSEPVVVDHSPPELASTGTRGGVLSVRVEDELSPLREALYSVDGGEWKHAVAADGLLDGRSETLEIPRPADGSLLMLQVADAAFNGVTFDLSSKE